MKETSVAPGALAALLLVAACGGPQAGQLARATVDTLPGGIPRVSNAAPTAWRDSAGGRLVEVARFSGEDGTRAELGNPRGLAVDAGGRIYVADVKPALIKVFSPDGRLVRTIGGEGAGPGEFRTAFIAVRGGNLVVHDPQIGRTSVFDTAGTFQRSWLSSCCYWSDIQVDRQDRIYVPSMVATQPGTRSRGVAYVRWSLDGTALDTLWVPVRETEKLWTISVKSGGKVVGSMTTSIPLMPEITQTLHPEGGFVYGWTGDYQIVRSPAGADTAMLFGRTWTPDPVNDARRQREVEDRIKQVSGGYGEAAARSAFRIEDIPHSFPSFQTLRVDGAGRVWVRRFAVDDTLHTVFDVFDSTGALLGSVRAPVRIPEWGPQAWTADGVVVAIEDADGRPTVVRLRLVTGPEKK